MINRRNFLAALIAGATMDPEWLLWIPGRKKIFIPRAQLHGDVLTYEMVVKSYNMIVKERDMFLDSLRGIRVLYENTDPIPR